MMISQKKHLHAGGSISWFTLFNTVFMLALSFVILYPFWQVFILSFSDAREATTLGFHLWPQSWSLDAYKFLFGYDEVLRMYYNSIQRTVLGTALAVTLTILAAYPLSKLRLPFRKSLMLFYIIPMFFTGGMIPNYLLIRNLGLLDNFLALILPTAVSIFSVIIMRNYFMMIDQAYEESAFIDGANYFVLLIRIILPISVPVIATISLWAAVNHWNAWFDAMIYIRDRDKMVIQNLMREMLTEVTDMNQDMLLSIDKDQALLSASNVRSAIALISIGPIVLLYPYLQKYFIKGIMLGSLKG